MKLVIHLHTGGSKYVSTWPNWEDLQDTLIPEREVGSLNRKFDEHVPTSLTRTGSLAAVSSLSFRWIGLLPHSKIIIHAITTIF